MKIGKNLKAEMGVIGNYTHFKPFFSYTLK
jgi:hypothetical protein